MSELLAALCLMVVLEGLFLFAMPISWKRTVIELVKLPVPVLRRIGAGVVAAGLVGLWLVRHLGD